MNQIERHVVVFVFIGQKDSIILQERKRKPNNIVEVYCCRLSRSLPNLPELLPPVDKRLVQTLPTVANCPTPHRLQPPVHRGWRHLTSLRAVDSHQCNNPLRVPHRPFRLLRQRIKPTALPSHPQSSLSILRPSGPDSNFLMTIADFSKGKTKYNICLY